MKALLLIAVALSLLCADTLIGGIMNSDEIDQDLWDWAVTNLRNPDAKVRIAAAESLPDKAVANRVAKRSPEQELAPCKQLRSLAEIIRDKNEDPRVRGQLIRAIAIAGLGTTAQVAATSIVDVLKDETDDEGVRCWATICLPDIGPPQLVAPAILEATKSRSERVRMSVFETTGQFVVDSEDLFRLASRGIRIRAIQFEVLPRLMQ